MQNKILTTFQYSEDSLLVLSEHNSWLVILSISIAIFASFMGFKVAFQAATTSSYRKHIWLLIGSIALGGGVWSMHFIGMLALKLCTDISYQLNLTIVSVLPAIAASWVALNLITRKNLETSRLVAGGILVGSGIGTMHYVGMAAMEMALLLRYDLFMFCVSILVAITLAIMALWVSFGVNKLGRVKLSRRAKITISSCVMGAAISGMHYTGMAAARFVLPPDLEVSQQSSQITFYLAIGITAITVFIIGLVLAANLVFSYKDKSAAAVESERRLSAIMDTAIDGIITIDSAGIIVSINKAVTTLLQWNPEELMGANVKMIVPKPFQHEHDKYIQDFLKTGIAKIIGAGREVEAVSKNGEMIPIRLGIGHVEFNGQHMFVAFMSDLRERIRMEANLRENEAQIRALLTNIPGIAYRCLDVPGWPNLFINDEVEKVTGYPAKDFLLPNPKRSLSDFVHPDDFHIIEATDLRAPNGYQIEFRLTDRYDNTKWMLGYGRAIKTHDSEEYYLDGFIMDISERKKMESELVIAKETAEKAAETRATFLANMSHEIRTPMNAVIGFSDILLDEPLEAHQRKHLHTINQSAKSLLHILNDILDSAKLEKGKFQLEYRDFSLVEEIDSVVSTLWLQADLKGLELDLNLPPDINVYYNGVPDRIRQVLTNLIGNAIKFTEKGRVTITISHTDDRWVKFSIQDTGIGMNKFQVETVFEAFAQGDESMSRRFGGTGLGTTISKQLVELMGGEIAVNSVQDRGTEFTFSIPLKPVSHDIDSTPASKNNVLPSLKVLIVDDIDQNIDLLTLLLKREGHSVLEARDGEQALLQMEKNAIDIVLMDIQMPIMDGLTASRRRREFEVKHKLEKLPIIALTASVLPKDRSSAEQAGMNGFANKPIDMKQLNNEIAQVLNLQNVPSSVEALDSKDKQTLQINVNKGIELWGSKTHFYAEVKRFIKSSENDILGLTQLFQQQDWRLIQELAHKFKGGAGNLAMNTLMALFDELEQSCLNRSIEIMSNTIKLIELEFEQTKSFIQGWGEHKKQSPKSRGGLDKSSIDDVVHVLLKLEQHLSNNEFDEELLNELHNFESFEPKSISAIIGACNDFEFKIASEWVHMLIEKLNSDND